MSLAALLISLLSLTLSAYGVLRDRHRLVASAEYLESYANMCDGVLIRVTNIGRRPISPRQLRIEMSGERKWEHTLRDGNKPVVLAESAYWEIVLDPKLHDLDSIPLESITRCIVIDSHDQQYDVREGVSLLRKWARFIC